VGGIHPLLAYGCFRLLSIRRLAVGVGGEGGSGGDSDAGVRPDGPAEAIVGLDEAYRRNDVMHPNVFRRPTVVSDFLAERRRSPVTVNGAVGDISSPDVVAAGLTAI
jgi:hypothetical protein